MQLAGFWRYQNRTQGTYNFFGSVCRILCLAVRSHACTAGRVEAICPLTITFTYPVGAGVG